LIALPLAFLYWFFVAPSLLLAAVSLRGERKRADYVARRLAERTEDLPPATVIVPVKGYDEGLRENVEHHAIVLQLHAQGPFHGAIHVALFNFTWTGKIYLSLVACTANRKSTDAGDCGFHVDPGHLLGLFHCGEYALRYRLLIDNAALRPTCGRSAPTPEKAEPLFLHQSDNDPRVAAAGVDACREYWFGCHSFIPSGVVP